jgi:hypothetical protein
MNRTVWLILLVGFFISGCRVQLPVLPSYESTKIITPPGPEDFVLHKYNYNEKLLISCSSRRRNEDHSGEIVSYDLKTEALNILPRFHEPENFVFRPHGIDLVKDLNGRLMLYAVNHQPGVKRTINSVVQYELRDDSLFFINNYLSNLIVSPNDVTALPDGSFYVTNDSRHTRGIGLLFEKLFQTRASKIIYKSPDNNFSVAAKRLSYANGIAFRNNNVWIACTFKKDLVEYTRNDNGSLNKVRNLPGIKGMDNISLFGNSLIIASHADFKKFLKHIKSSADTSPGVVSIVNLANNSIEHIYANNGSAISANSVALIHNNTLYIGQVFDGFILKVNLFYPDDKPGH